MLGNLNNMLSSQINKDKEKISFINKSIEVKQALAKAKRDKIAYVDKLNS